MSPTLRPIFSMLEFKPSTIYLTVPLSSVFGIKKGLLLSLKRILGSGTSVSPIVNPTFAK